ncbi:hypothetical protein GGF32_006505 [Allomyces javanicus]|nr:hypothetical protein GGF32_006505 [Allomyces javanicus]
MFRSSRTLFDMKYLSKFGYRVDKADLSAAQVLAIKSDLTVRPVSDSEYGLPPSFRIYAETPSQYIVPTWYGIKTLGRPDKSFLALDVPSQTITDFRGQLRESQVEPMDICLNYVRTNKRGVLCLPTGTGKTFCSLYLASKLGQRTLVIVNKRTLMDQWRDEIKRFIPNAQVGTIHQTACDPSGDITIAMWQTLNARESVPGTYGLIILDECHRVSSRIFNTVLFKINAPYVLGLSATPERKDGLESVMHHHIGEIMYRQQGIKRGTLATAVLVADYRGQYTVSPRQFSTFVTELVKDQARTDFIAEVIQSIFSRSDGDHRHVLVLTDRVQHAQRLSASVTNVLAGKSVAVFTGQSALKDFDRAKSADVIIATYKIFEEGISVESLNTLVLATPKRTVTQAVGRIYRREHRIPPLIVDIADGQLKSQLQSRLDTYSQETGGNLAQYESLEYTLPTGTAMVVESIFDYYHPIDTLGATAWIDDLEQRLVSMQCRGLTPLMLQYLEVLDDQLNESLDNKSKTSNEAFKSAIDVYETMRVIKEHIHAKVPAECIQYVCSQMEPAFAKGFTHVRDAILDTLEHPDYQMPVQMLTYKFLAFLDGISDADE